MNLNALRVSRLALAVLAAAMMTTVFAGGALAGDNLKKGQAALQHNDLGTAIPLLNRAVAEEPTNLDAHATLALALIRLHKYTEAKAEIEQCTKLSPDNEVIPFLDGQVAEGQDDLDGAIAKYRAALARKSKYADASYSLGRALRHSGKAPEGLAELNRGLDFAKESDVPRFLAEIGLALMDEDSLSAAADSASRAVALDPENVLTHMALGEIYLKRGVYSLAKSSLDRAVQIDSLNPVVFYQLGKADYYSQQYSDALLAFKTAAALDSLYPEPQYWIGHLYVLAGVADREKYTTALQPLRNYTRFRPNDNKGWLDLGDALYHQPGKNLDEANEAAAALDKAGELKPDDARPYLLLVKVCAYKLDDLNRAFGAFKKLQGLNAKMSSEDILLVGSLYVKQADFASADSVFKEAVKADSTASDPWYKLAESKFFQRDYAGAIPYLEQRIAVDSLSERTRLGVQPFLPYFMLGQSLNQLQKYDTAAVVLKKAVFLADSSAQPASANDRARVHLELGTSYVKGDSTHRAMAEGEFMATIAADSSSKQASNAYFNLGYLDYANKAYKDAAEHFENCLSIVPQRVDALIFLSVSYAQLKENDKAREAARKGLAIDPNNKILLQIANSANQPAPAKKTGAQPPAQGGTSQSGAKPGAAAGTPATKSTATASAGANGGTKKK